MKNRGRKKGGRKLDTSAAREVLQDDRGWIYEAVVVQDGASHFEVTNGDVYVDVELVPSELPLRARLGCIAGGPGDGIWRVPAVGTEVAVMIPGGVWEAGGVILATLSTRNVPEGIAEGRTVIVAPQVLVYDTVSGDAVPLATKADIDALTTHIDTHKHAGLLGGTGSALALTTTPQDPLSTPDPAPTPAGTSILKAK